MCLSTSRTLLNNPAPGQAAPTGLYPEKGNHLPREQEVDQVRGEASLGGMEGGKRPAESPLGLEVWGHWFRASVEPL